MATTIKSMSAALALLLLACNGEPYPIEGTPNGELPDQDLDVEAELADPGGEMHDPIEAFGPLIPCTPEELEEHRKANTFGDRVNEEGCVGGPRRPVPPDPPNKQR